VRLGELYPLAALPPSRSPFHPGKKDPARAIYPEGGMVSPSDDRKFAKSATISQNVQLNNYPSDHGFNMAASSSIVSPAEKKIA
jgi:hypothetical protein